jgi:expansin (peptidoglycan-binding protein)
VVVKHRPAVRRRVGVGRSGAGRIRALLRRPLVAVPAATVATALTVVTAIGVSRSAACAAAPTAGHSYSGTATFYELGDGVGNCSYSAPADRLYVALGDSEYADSAACGAYLSVSGPRGSVRVQVIDRCPECQAGHLDLSTEAFRAIADPVQGVVGITFRLAAGPGRTPGFRVKDGSNPYWLAIQPVDAGRAVTRLEVRTGSGWQALTRTSYNYFVAESGAGPGPFTLRLTDSTGRQVTSSGITLSPGAIQRTGAQVAAHPATATGGNRSTSAAGRDRSPGVRASASTPRPTPTTTRSRTVSPTTGSAPGGVGLAEEIRGEPVGGRCR